MSDRYTLQFARDAKKSLRELQPKQFKQVATKIFALLDNPQPQDHLGFAIHLKFILSNITHTR
jgi:mRNA-degrading endonuclease RelE of RelBE toxin-antitoxin system